MPKPQDPADDDALIRLVPGTQRRYDTMCDRERQHAPPSLPNRVQVSLAPGTVAREVGQNNGSKHRGIDRFCSDGRSSSLVSAPGDDEAAGPVHGAHFPAYYNAVWPLAVVVARK